MHRPHTAYRPRRSYEGLREVLAPELAGLPPRRLAEALDETFGAQEAASLESFWKGFKKFGKAAGGVLQQALPAVATVAGTAFGGPVGGAVAGAAGQALSGALGGALQGAGPRRRGRAHGRRPGAAHGLTQREAGGSPAAAQLLKAILDPKVTQAVLGMALGPAGRQNVNVGGAPVPLGAFANLLGQLAERAAAEYHQAGIGEATGIPSYLLDESGEFIGDPADPVQRAEVLLQRLADAAEEEEEQEDADTDGEDTDGEDERLAFEQEMERFYDELELAEAYEDEA
jgi:hypothetical protein